MPLGSHPTARRRGTRLCREPTAILAAGSQEHVSAGEVAVEDVVHVQVLECRRYLLQRLQGELMDGWGG